MTVAGESVALGQLTGDTGLLAASVALDAARTGAIGFELAVRNLTDGPVEVTNPYGGTTYHLIAASGTPVQVRAPRSQAKVHVPVDPRERLAYLDLAAAACADEPLAPDELIGLQELTLPPGASATLSLAITAAIDPADRAVLDAVPAGDYGLVVQLRVVCVIDGTAHPTLFRTTADLPVAVS